MKTSFATIATFVAAAISTVSAAPVDSNLSKRSFSGKATFYTPGLGSCGSTDSDSSMIVAMNVEQGNGFCGKQISITNESSGKTTTATVHDLCPGCGQGDLDMSPAVFSALGGTTEEGTFPISWSFS